MTDIDTPPDDSYPASWRPKHLPAPDEELPPLEVETYLAALTPAEFQAMMPTQFGAFKIFKGLTEFGLGLAKSQSGQDNGYGNGSGGGGGGGLVDSLLGLIPQPYGDVNNGSPTDAPGEFIPGLSQGGSGSLPNFMAGFVPSGPGQPGQVQDNSTNLNIVNPQYGRQEPVMAEVDEFLFRDSRTGLRNVPR